MPQNATAAEKRAAQKANDLLSEGIAAYEKGQLSKAGKLASKAVAAGPDVVDATRLVELLRVTGQPDASADLAEATLARLTALAEAESEDSEAVAEYGHLMLELDRADMAEPVLLRAHELGESGGRAEVLLLNILLERGEADKLLRIWERFLNDHPDQARFVLMLVRGLAHFGFPEQAESVLQHAEPLYAADRGIYHKTLANIRGDSGEMSQSEEAVRLFDEAAAGYDENLAAIGNAGPAMIALMLQKIGLKPGAGLNVLDAGCGSGLCAPFLRPFAAQVHGCDVSVKMLELCKEKKLYDLLTRTDLNTPATFPQGPFDLVVSGDVLVYFGDLAPVLKNVADVLKPGGWFVFTVEHCDPEEAPDAGHLVRSSGRHAHTPDHVSRALTAAGLSKPKDEFSDVLRKEFRQPVMGRAVAAQKLAIFGAM